MSSLVLLGQKIYGKVIDEEEGMKDFLSVSCKSVQYQDVDLPISLISRSSQCFSKTSESPSNYQVFLFLVIALASYCCTCTDSSYEPEARAEIHKTARCLPNPLKQAASNKKMLL